MKYSLLVVALIFTSQAIKQVQDPQVGKPTAFPALAQPPTAPDQLGKFKFNVPPFSKSLFEIDPERQLRKVDFINYIKFSLYNLSRGEISLIYDFADANNDDLLSQEEWLDFTRLYVYPYESCDTNKDYGLDNKEFEACYEVDPKFKIVKFTEYHQKDKFEWMQRIIKHRREKLVNFFSYMMLKNAMFAWEKCYSSSHFIDKQNFRCALSLGIPERYSLDIDYDLIFDIALDMSNNIELRQLDFISYLRIYDISYAFVVFSHPKGNPFIEKQTFINNIKQDSFPTTLQIEDIEYIYHLINNHPYHDVTQMTFKTFAFFYNLENILNFNTNKAPKSINRDEIAKIFQDPFLKQEFYFAMVGSTGAFEEKEYIEGSLILQKLRVNQQQFFFKFKQEERPYEQGWGERNHKNLYFIQQNHFVKESFVFRIMADMNKEYWDKKIYYRTFQLINFFVFMCEDIRWIIPQTKFVREMATLYDKAEPPINLNQRRNLMYYRFFPDNVWIDLATFLKIENFLFKIHYTQVKDSSTIPEHLIKLILKDYAMEELPDDVLDTCGKGFDSLRRRLFDVHKTPVTLMLTEVVTSELVRDKFAEKYHKLKENTYASRIFPEEKRRFEVSPHV